LDAKRWSVLRESSDEIPPDEAFIETAPGIYPIFNESC
jgi:hypothetical protein